MKKEAWAVATGAAALILLALAGPTAANAATPNVPSQGTSSATSAPTVTLTPGAGNSQNGSGWTLPDPAAAGGSGVQPDAEYGGCYGGFLNPQLVNGDDALHWGDELLCSSAVNINLGMEIDQCVRDGGPDDFDCSPAVAVKGKAVNSTYNATYALKRCIASDDYRPVAFDITVKGKDYGDVYGNPENFACK